MIHDLSCTFIFVYKQESTGLHECFTCEACGTFTPVEIHLVHACAVVLTGTGSTFIDVQITVIALKSRHTEALVAINAVPANGSILTRFWLAFIYVDLTLVPLVASSTLTPGPIIRDIYTNATMLTEPLWACGNIFQAALSSESKGTVTRVSIGPVDAKWPDTFTRVTLAFIHILSAVKTRQTIWTVAGKLISPWNAGAVGAWCSDAGIQQLFTVLAHEPNWSFRAQARVVIQIVKTRGAVETRRWQTLVSCCCAQQTWKEIKPQIRI